MKKKLDIPRGVLNYILNSVFHGASIPASCRLAGVKLRVLRQYRRTHGIYDKRLRKLREPYSLLHTLFKKDK